MIYVLKNQKVIMEDGTIATVDGIATLVSTKDDFVEIDVITMDMDEFRGTMTSKDRKEANIADIVNVMLDEKCETDEVAIELLSEKFAELYDEMGDGQEAFDFLMEEDMNGMLDDFDFVYSVTGDNWNIEVDETADDSIVDIVNEAYGSNAEDLDEACSVVERQVSKTMSNVGCDPYTALRLEKEDDCPDCFKVKAESDRAYIELLDI